MGRGKGRRSQPVPESHDPGLRGPDKRFCRCGKLALTEEDAWRRAEAEMSVEGYVKGLKKGVYKCKRYPEDPWWHTYTIRNRSSSQKTKARRRRQQVDDILAKARELYGLEEKEKETIDEADTDA